MGAIPRERARRGLEPLAELPRLGPDLTGLARHPLRAWPLSLNLLAYEHTESENRVVALTIEDAHPSSRPTSR